MPEARGVVPAGWVASRCAAGGAARRAGARSRGRPSRPPCRLLGRPWGRQRPQVARLVNVLRFVRTRRRGVRAGRAQRATCEPRPQRPSSQQGRPPCSMHRVLSQPVSGQTLRRGRQPAAGATRRAATPAVPCRPPPPPPLALALTLTLTLTRPRMTRLRTPVRGARSAAVHPRVMLTRRCLSRCADEEFLQRQHAELEAEAASAGADRRYGGRGGAGGPAAASSPLSMPSVDEDADDFGVYVLLVAHRAGRRRCSRPCRLPPVPCMPGLELRPEDRQKKFAQRPQRERCERAFPVLWLSTQARNGSCRRQLLKLAVARRTLLSTDGEGHHCVVLRSSLLPPSPTLTRRETMW